MNTRSNCEPSSHDAFPIAVRRRSSAISWLLFAALATGGCDLLSDPRERAAELLAKGDFAAARIEASSAIQKNESDPEAYLLLGEVLMRQGDYATAEGTLAKAATLGADADRVDRLRAKALSKLTDHVRLLDTLKPLPSHGADTLALVYAARGVAHLAQRNRDEAEASFQRAYQAVPDHREASIGFAKLAFIDGNFDEALRRIERVVANSPRDAGALEAKAAILYALGRRDDARVAFDLAAAAEPAEVDALISAAQLAIQARQFDEARKRIEEARKRMPNALLVRHVQAMLDFQEKRYEKALAAAQEILRVQPKFAPTVVLAVSAHLVKGEVNQADTLLRPLVQAMPGNLAVHRLHAMTLLSAGDPQGAMNALQPVLTDELNDPEVLALAGEVASRLKNFSQATALYERAAKLQPDRPELLARSGLARVVSGDFAQGMATLGRASAASASDIEPDIALAVLSLRRGEYAHAFAAAERIQEKSASNPIGFNLAGAALAAKKDLARARRQFERALEVDPAFWPAAANLVRLDIESGQRDAARKRVERIVAADKANVEAVMVLLQLTGDRGLFVKTLEDARASDAKALPPRLVLIATYLDQGLPDKALPIAREALAIAPNRSYVVELLGRAELASGRSSEALTRLRNLASLDPKSASVQIRIAEVQAAMNDLKGAETTLRKALTLKPGDIEATLILARLLAGQDRTKDALDLLQEVRRVHPKNPLGHTLAGDVLTAAKRYAEAAKAYNAAYAVGPSGALVVRKHVLRMLAGEKPGEAELERWLAQHPQDAVVRVHLGDQHYVAGRYREALSQYERVASADPNHATALNNAASALIKLNDARALTHAEAALRLRPDDPRLLDTFGVAQMRYGKPDAAVEALKKAVARWPENIEIRVNYALALASAGDKLAAREELQRLVDGSKTIALGPDAQALLDGR